MHDCDEDEDWGRVPARRFQAIDLIGIGTQMVAEMFEAASDAFSSVSDLVMAHSNHREDRDKFAEQAAREIETLTWGDDGD